MSDQMQVHIRRNIDGVIRVYLYDGGWEEYSDYMWLAGGNYSCDCNRYLFFQRSAGGDEVEHPCGDTAYSILKFVLPDGTEVAGDDDV
jgi:hypothetical protein